MSHGELSKPDPDGMVHVQAVPQLNLSNKFMRHVIYGAVSDKDSGGHGSFEGNLRNNLVGGTQCHRLILTKVFLAD